jgi:DNA-binding NarL/FixJ family response regulator
LNGRNAGSPKTGTVRPHEANRLTAVIADAQPGRPGRVVELVGEPGAGKTWLVAAATRAAARQGMRVVSARCTENEQQDALHPFLHVLISQGVPFSSLAGTHAPLNVHGEVRQALARLAKDSALLVLDDFHFADDDSVRLLDQLVRNPVAGLVLVVAYRTRQASAHLRDALVTGAELGTVESVPLRALSLSQSAQLLSIPERDGRLKQLHDDSGGVPAYLLELARTQTGDSIPEQQPTTLLTELAALGPAESVTMAAGAVLGGTFDFEAISAVAELQPGQSRAAMTSLMGRDLIRPVDHPPAYALRHPVVRDVVYARTDPAWRISAHRRALRLLTARNAPVMARAPHVERLLDRPPPGDLPALAQAAEDAIADHATAATRWMQALLVSSPGDQMTESLRLRLATAYARALIATDQPRQARETLRDVVTTVSGDPPEVRATAIALCAQLDWLLGFYTEAGNLIHAELAGFAERPPLYAIQLVVSKQFILGQLNDAHAYAQAVWCARLAHDEGDRVAEIGALALRAAHETAAADLHAARATLRECAAIADRLPDQDIAHNVEYLTILGWAECGIEQFADARRHLRRSILLAKKTGLRHLLPFMLAGLSKAHLAAGPLDEAERAAREACLLARSFESEQMTGLALAMLACCSVEAEPDLKSAVALAEHAGATLSIDESWWRTDLTMSLAGAVLAAGDPLRCIALLTDLGGGSDLDQLPLVKKAASFAMMARAAADTGDRIAANRWLGQVRAVAETTGLTSHRAHSQAAQAHVLRAAGEPNKALQMYRAAADSFSTVLMVRSQASMLVAAASCAVAAGLSHEAASMLALGRELARRSGAWVLYRRAQAGQRHLTEGSADADRAPGLQPLREKLTAREFEVARIAAVGKRTKEIAEELKLSARTVEVHLSNIYRKLDVSSRAALASKIAGAS